MAERFSWRPDRGRRRARWALAGELWRTSRPLSAAAAANLVAGSILPVAFVLVTGATVAQVRGAVAGGFGSPAGHRLVTGVVWVAVLAVITQVMSSVDETVTAALARRVRTRTFARAMAATLRPATVAHLEDPELLDVVAASTFLGPIGPGAATAALIGQWRRLLVGATSLLVLARFHWWLALLLGATELHALARNRVTYNQLVAFRVLHLPGLRRAVYLRNVALRPDAAKETRVFGLAPWVVQRFRSEWLGTMTELWAKRKGNAGQLAAAILPVAVAEVFTFWLLGRAGIDHRIGLGALVAYAGVAMNSVGLCISGDDLSIEEGGAITASTAALEAAVTTDARLLLPGSRTPAAGLPTRELRFEGVSFAYPGRTAAVLRDLDLVVPAGRSLAIVGDNGAGKTTLVKLLARLYDPTAGRITADGVDLTELDPAAWQQRIAAVFQDFVRYPFSAEDNVTLGFPGPASKEDAARRAGAAAVIEALPRGWETVLSRDFAGGTDLSGGEWQRVALARALYAASRRAGGVLILDEPTAHLDARGEAEFFDTFLEVTRGCTTILISHRFSTVRRADRIVVLDGGRVTESGTHDELVAAGGRYAHLFSLQAARFA